MSSRRRRLIVAIVVIVLLLVTFAAMYGLRHAGRQVGEDLLVSVFVDETLPEGFASGNGRIEATEVDVATKLAGRLTAVVPREGDRVPLILTNTCIHKHM